MGAIKVFLKEVLLPIALAFCLASFLKPIYMPDGVCDYFLMWICVLLQDCPLCFNAYAVTIVFIVPAQSHIKRRVVNRSIVRLFHR